MNILFQFPTKGRTQKFFSTLDLYYKSIRDISRCHFHIVIDHFDYAMNNSVTLHKLSMYENLSISAIPEDSNKIKACNYNIQKNHDWDIVVLISDDMIPQVKGIDDIIVEQMQKNFPSTDGCIWFNDGYTRKRLCTLSILGRKYYDRFGYIYHPSYTSMWSDNEFMIVALTQKKMVYIDDIIIKHEHPANNPSIANDEHYKLNEPYYHKDKEVFEKRKSLHFGLPTNLELIYEAAR